MRCFYKFCQSHSISNPCIHDKFQDEHNLFIAMHASCLAIVHTLLTKDIESNTIMTYLRAAALLCLKKIGYSSCLLMWQKASLKWGIYLRAEKMGVNA
eukprot:97589-Ditylum_brightwellii.AAC.1